MGFGGCGNHFVANKPWQAPITGGQFGLIMDMLPEIKDLKVGEHPFGTRLVRQFDE